MLSSVGKNVEIWRKYRDLARRDAVSGAELSLVVDRTSRINKNDIVLVACMRNEAFRIPKFIEYYRNIGVDHFIFIDNGSNDELQEIIAKDEGVSCYHTQR